MGFVLDAHSLIAVLLDEPAAADVARAEDIRVQGVPDSTGRKPQTR